MEELPVMLSGQKNALVTNVRTALRGCHVPTTHAIRSQSWISVSVKATMCPLRMDLPGRMLQYRHPDTADTDLCAFRQKPG
jgi:hypothetical protein